MVRGKVFDFTVMINGFFRGVISLDAAVNVLLELNRNMIETEKGGTAHLLFQQQFYTGCYQKSNGKC